MTDEDLAAHLYHAQEALRGDVTPDDLHRCQIRWALESIAPLVAEVERLRADNDRLIQDNNSVRLERQIHIQTAMRERAEVERLRAEVATLTADRDHARHWANATIRGGPLPEEQWAMEVGASDFWMGGYFVGRTADEYRDQGTKDYEDMMGHPFGEEG